ncbi:MAG: cytochrome c3 family protein [bacterium]|nr:cytochrome c3 family protein [bacterium]
MKTLTIKILLLIIFFITFNTFAEEKKDCYDCHKDLKEKFQKKYIHKPLAKNGCTGCHKDHGNENKLMLKAEGNDLCYLCHDSYEVEFKKQSKLAVIKLSHFNLPVGRDKSQCIECHDPHSSDEPKLIYSNQHKPFAEKKCLECHEKPVFWQPVKFVAEGSSLCIKCHKIQEKSNVHTPVKEGKCILCHDPHTSKNKFMLRAEYNSKLCALCHENKTKGEINHSPVKDGDCMACHAVHSSDNANHLKEKVNTLCYSCHDKMTGQGVDHSPVAEEDCTVCHNPHSSANDKLLIETKVGGKLCNNCHEDKTKGKFKHVPADEGGDCMVCHDPHTSKNKFLLKKTEKELCYDCHENKTSKEFKHLPVDKGECHKCHDSHSSPYIYQLRNENDKRLCYMCHENKEKTKYVHTPVAEGNCKGCHDPHSSDVKFQLKAKGNDFCYMCHQSKKEEFDKKVVHKPIKEENGCLKCHMHHGSPYYRNLRGEYPEEHQVDYAPEKFGLCFMCHDAKITTYKFIQGKESDFRRGELNLHFLHVNQQKKRGRKCTVCHSPHATDNYRMLYDNVPFGVDNFRYKYPVGFSQNEMGKSCLPGCHGRKYYGPDMPSYMK